MGDICGDNRFEIIDNAKKELLRCTNIDSSPNEMAVLDSILFRMWQMKWLPGCNEAHWTLGDEYEYAYCSKCGRMEYADFESSTEAKENIGDFHKFHRYCSGCGAKMVEDKLSSHE